MSSKQITANRQNAQKSTGPRTANGRAVSKMNAVKHGILSREVVVRGLHIKESHREYAALHQRFFDALEPIGPVEEMLVDQIVTAHWRLRRALTAESGEIALSVDEGQWKRSRELNPQLQWMQWQVWGDPVPSMRNSSLGNSVLASWLRDVRARVEQEGELAEAAIKIPFFGKPNELSEGLESLRQRLLEKTDAADPTARREENKQEALAYIDRELRTLEWRQADCSEREAAEEDARQAAAVLPTMEVLEKIMRYETKLERQLYRAMAQLERLQRMRKGETLPAPLAVISDRL